MTVSPEGTLRLTAIQLSSEGPITARLLCGGPVSIVGSERGEVALLPPGRVVAYLVGRKRTTGLYVFRTAISGELTTVPGVGAPVRLLLSSGKRANAKRTRNFIRRVTSYGYDPSELSDDFWLRAAGALLARRRPSHHLLSSLIARETAR
jgi:hypothetical protein